MSFVVHNDMRSQTKAMLKFGRRAVVPLLNKQKVNSTSSILAAIIGVDDAIIIIMMVKLFIEHQYKNLPMDLKIKKLGTKLSVLHHDNKSSIRLEANGKRSSTKQTRHIDIRYFYVTDKVKSRDVVIVHHLIEVIVRNFLSKPLNWTPFKSQ